MEIPWQKLERATLDRVIEEFVTREGTDYGSDEFTLEQKVEQVRHLLRRREVVLVFDEESETCHIMPGTLAR